MGGFSSLFSFVSRTLPLGVTQRATALYFRASKVTKVGLRGYHSDQKLVSADTMRVRILPALSDNYMYLLVDENTNEAAIVDPVEPDTVIKVNDSHPMSMWILAFGSKVFLRASRL